MSDEWARAAGEIAKTTGKAVDAGVGAASYLDRVFNDIPEAIAGLGGGNWLVETHRRQRLKLAFRTEQLVREWGRSIDECEPNPALVTPIIHAAQDEIRDELTELFARLLATSMLPDQGTHFRRQFIEVVRRMEPLDAQLFKAACEAPTAQVWAARMKERFPSVKISGSPTQFALEDFGKSLGQTDDAVSLALNNLASTLKCIDINADETRLSGNHLKRVFSEHQRLAPESPHELPDRLLILSLTVLGKELRRALNL